VDRSSRVHQRSHIHQKNALSALSLTFIMTDVLRDRSIPSVASLPDKLENRLMFSIRSILGTGQVSTIFSVLFFGLFGLLFGFGMLPKSVGFVVSLLSFVFSPHVINTNNLSWIRLYSYFYLVLGLVNWFNKSVVVSRNQVTLTSLVNLVWCFHILTEFWSYKSIQLPFILAISSICLGSYVLSRGGTAKMPAHTIRREEHRAVIQ